MSGSENSAKRSILEVRSSAEFFIATCGRKLVTGSSRLQNVNLVRSLAVYNREKFQNNMTQCWKRKSSGCPAAWHV